MRETSTCYALFLQPQEHKEGSMKQTRVYVGLDVEDTQYHGSAFNKDKGTAWVSITPISRLNIVEAARLQECPGYPLPFGKMPFRSISANRALAISIKNCLTVFRS